MGYLHDLSKKENGTTLMETIVVVIIVGVALPSLMVLMGNLSFNSFKNELLNNAINLASSRLEEIQAFKETNWDWYKTINTYDGDEQLEKGFMRRTKITYHKTWGANGSEAYEVTISIQHKKLSEIYNLRIFLTKYVG